MKRLGRREEETKDSVGKPIIENDLIQHGFSPLHTIRQERDRDPFLTSINHHLPSIDKNPSSFTLSISDTYKVAFFFNTPATHLPAPYLSQLSDSFCSVFNTSWGEKWTVSSAQENICRITDSFNGSPVIGLLLFNENVVGFIICKLKNVSDITIDDFPYALSLELKEDSVIRTKYVYETVLNAKSLLVIQEIGIAAHADKSLQSKLLSPYLCYPAIKHAHSQGAFAMLFWTNTSSQAFNWGVSIKWFPFHFYHIQDLVLMQGSTRSFIDSAHKLFPDSIRLHAKELQRNKRHYLCNP